MRNTDGDGCADGELLGVEDYCEAMEDIVGSGELIVVHDLLDFFDGAVDLKVDAWW